MAVLLSASLFFLGCGGDDDTVDDSQSDAAKVDALALDTLVARPVQNAEPLRSITAEQYTGTIAWDPIVAADGTFAPSTVYKATADLEAAPGRTFDGDEVVFTHGGGAVTQTANTGSTIKVAIVFPPTQTAEGNDNPVSETNLSDLVTKPDTGVAAQTAFAGTAQYSGSISWAPPIPEDGKFLPKTAYTATVELLAKTAYTFVGVGTLFSHDVGSASQTAGTATGITVSILFGATGGTETDPGPVTALDLATAIAAPVTAETVVTTFTSPDPDQYTGAAVVWTDDSGTAAGAAFAGGTVYKAEVTLTPKPGYEFATAGGFVYAGATVTKTMHDNGTATVAVTFKPTDTVVSAVDLATAIAKPVTGAAPSDVFTTPNAAQYDGGTVTWDSSVAEGGVFAADTAYTATVTLTAEDGYTFATAAFVYGTLTATATANDDGTVTVAVAFGNTAAVVSDVNLTQKLAKPAKNAAKALTVDGPQYTGTVAWKDADGNPFVATNFAAATRYEAEVTLKAQGNFTFTGFAGTFSYAGVAAADMKQTPVSDDGTVTVTIPFPEQTADSEVTVTVDLDPIRVARADGGSLTNITLTKGDAASAVTLTVSSAADSTVSFGSIKWLVDGNNSTSLGSGTSLKLDPAAAYATVRTGAHHVTVQASIGSKVYSQTVAFTVVAAGN
jgi:hypothetical protein